MKLLQPNPVHIQLSSDWKYVPASRTNISKTFQKERARLAKIISDQKIKPSKVREFRTK